MKENSKQDKNKQLILVKACKDRTLNNETVWWKL